MINQTLFKRELKANFKVFIIIFAVLMMYITIITGMFDPELGSVLEQFTKVMPELMNAFGMANQLVARYVDRGSMAYLLATPSSRLKIILTQACVLWISLALLIGRADTWTNCCGAAYVSRRIRHQRLVKYE